MLKHGLEDQEDIELPHPHQSLVLDQRDTRGWGHEHSKAVLHRGPGAGGHTILLRAHGWCACSPLAPFIYPDLVFGEISRRKQHHADAGHSVLRRPCVSGAFISPGLPGTAFMPPEVLVCPGINCR